MRWSADTLRVVAFWNHACGVPSQPWAANCYSAAGPEVEALQQHVEAGFLPLLEPSNVRAQFAHLSFQESQPYRSYRILQGRGYSDQARKVDAVGASSVWYSVDRARVCPAGCGATAQAL